ncbi:hypothetical protein BBK36DRAFT_1129694 [Trichoderma citrinoviride]|uniref:Uncharacterized protein n=1 Tax=Trichoderma citrinoviride TaxID=58853 RepID=A0A2T4AYK4_9HYPO|nr:hypothetical protein BBK36DRAFT_1129694 [Trichoderma citrinoviride]PTB62147.1 hypothetical protein BBK36DRAFT_1129694 [Trichoderma citrinoviride]
MWLTIEKIGKKNEITYNSRCSPVVTHLTTNLPLIGLTLGEQTGSRIFQWIWSYVLCLTPIQHYNHFSTTAEGSKRAKKKRHTTAGVRWWSPTQLLICRLVAYLWGSGRDPEFSTTYGRMCLKFDC